MKRGHLLLAICCLGAWAADKNEVVLEKRVEADWGSLTSGYLSDAIEVELTVLPSGEPYSVKAKGSLPDPAAHALMQWRFRPRTNAFSVSVRVPVRTPLDIYSDWSQMPSTSAPALRGAISDGAKLDAKGAELLSSQLSDDEQKANLRTKLLVYYALNGATTGETARKNRLDLVTWLIRTFPQDKILTTPYAMINASGEPLADKEGNAALKKEWLDAVQKHPDDTEVAAGAAAFLRVTDPEEAWKIMSSYKDWSHRSNWLGSIFAYGGLGVNAVALENGGALSSSDTKLPEDPFAARARQILLSSADLKVVLSGVASTIDLEHDLAGRSASPAGYAEYCEALVKHARELYPATSLSCTGDRPSPRENSAPRIVRVGGNVAEANLIRKVSPEYPQTAKDRRVQGTVEFVAMIGEDGKIRSLDLVSGPFLLYDSARDAVIQWQYRPTLLNGKPVSVVTAIIVNYTLSR